MPDNILNKVNSISKTDIIKWCEEYIYSKRPDLVIQIQERLKRGQNVKNVNDVIGEYASQNYAIFKQRMNPLAGGSVDLFLEGDLQRLLTIEKQSTNIFKIYSKDSKYKKLADKYEKEQFGLTEEQHLELNASMTIYVIEKIFEKILK